MTATSGRRTQEAQEIPRAERGAREDMEDEGKSGPYRGTQGSDPQTR